MKQKNNKKEAGDNKVNIEKKYQELIAQMDDSFQKYYVLEEQQEKQLDAEFQKIVTLDKKRRKMKEKIVPSQHDRTNHYGRFILSYYQDKLVDATLEEDPKIEREHIIDYIMDKGCISQDDHLKYNCTYMSWTDLQLRDEPEGEVNILVYVPSTGSPKYLKMDDTQKEIIIGVFKKLLKFEFLHLHDGLNFHGKAKTFNEAIDYAKKIFLAFFEEYWNHYKKADTDTAQEIANKIAIRRDGYITDSYWYTYHFGDMILFHIYEDGLLDEIKNILDTNP